MNINRISISLYTEKAKFINLFSVVKRSEFIEILATF